MRCGSRHHRADASINRLRERPGHLTLIGVGRSQHSAPHLSLLRGDDVQFEAGEPARRPFAEIRALVSQ